jgi:HK97 family phage portal protein
MDRVSLPGVHLMALLEAIRRALVPSPPVQVLTAEVPAQKAVTGAGAWVMEHHVPLNSSSRGNDPRWFKAAQKVSHDHPWVATAERVISGKIATVEWHLEDEKGELIEIMGDGPDAEIRRLIERPNPRMTRRYLWQLTSRHLGVCGNAFWFMDQRSGDTGMPLAIYYINPARMTPVTDKAGNLTRWALDVEDDYGYGSGIPLELDEVLHFTLEPPDWGHYGHGLVESAMSKIDLARYADRFITTTLASGGKRGGIASPKYEGLLPDDVYNAVTLAFRQVDDAALTKRTIVSKGSLDYTETSSTPEEMQLNAILELTRNDILGIWGVPLSAVGIALARGMNSGETQKYEEAALWQNGIHPRLVSMWETVQYGLVDRVDPTWKLVLEEPAFDDLKPLYEIAELAKVLPLKNSERRDLVGMDPFGDDRDEDVWLPKGFVRVYPEPLTPTRVAANGGLPVTGSDDERDAAQDDAEDVTRGKAKVGPLAGVRSKVEREATPDIKSAVARFLASQKADVVKRIRERAAHLLRKPKDASAALGGGWDLALAKILIPRAEDIAVTVATEAKRSVPAKKAYRPSFIGYEPGAAKADDFTDNALDFVRSRAGERITGINDTTRQAVQDAVAEVLEEAISQGLSPDEAGDLLADRIGGLAVWSDARADLIARTEMMLAYNDAALRSYDGLGVGEVMALDGDKDAECAARDGRVYPIADAYDISDHPNGTLDWAPVSKAVLKATVREPDVDERTLRRVLEEVLAQKAALATQSTLPVVIQVPAQAPAPVNVDVHVPEQPAPVITVNVPEQPAPRITVKAEPVVMPAPAQKAAPLVQDVRIVDSTLPPKRRVVRRDTYGRMTEINEE